MPRTFRLARIFLTALIFVGAGLHGTANAQYFGQNKVQYDSFDFRVLETEHFDIHYYPSQAEAAKLVASMAERWYTRLSKVLNHELSSRQAVVMYASHPEFEQTNVIEGQIDESTGGVTEGLRRRIVMPFAATLGETDHVLGHELVHAFQYDILGLRIGGTPLWFVEGMAEYLSTGPQSPTTAMWLRDAALEGRFPTIQELDSPQYFPYRFGHGFWAYIGGRFGDATVGTILHRLGFAGRAGGGNHVEVIENATGLSAEALSEAWITSVRSAYNLPVVERVTGRRKPEPPPEGMLVIGERTGHSGLNVGPSLSPDGSKIAFLSGRGRFAIDVYVADATTGRVLRSLTKSAVDAHFQSLQFIASSGTWSPDGQRLAVATVRAGRPVLAVFNVENGDLVQQIVLDRPGEILQPAWSPDGRSVAFTAQFGGTTDLYLHDFGAGTTRRLTEDVFADLHSVWTPDGRSVVFVTDRFSSSLASLTFSRYELARIDVATGAVTKVETGLTGNVYSPQFGTDANVIFLVSDSTGRPELYRLDVAAGRAVVVAYEDTGIAGITALSPSLSVARGTGRAAVTVFRDSGYEIRFLEPDQMQTTAPAPSGAPINFAALPPTERTASVVQRGLEEPKTGLPAVPAFPSRGYSPKLSLLGIGQSVGLSTGGPFGTYAQGGLSMLFSDMLGDHIVSASVDVNGRVRDIGGQLAYYNRQSRWNWGVFGSHAPLLSGSARAGFTTVGNQLVYVEEVLFDRQTYSTFGGSVSYPLSRTTRVELSAAGEHIGFTGEIETRFYDPVTGQLLQTDREDLPGGPGLTLARTGGAFVGDSTVFGLTGPILGQRFRFEAAPTFGQLSMTTMTADYRKYFMPVQPVTWATRLLHYGRYGSGSEDSRLYPLFLGYSSLVRGYDANSFEASECTVAADGSCPEFDRLIGSRMIVINTELRAPAVGLFTGNLSYGALPVELFSFFDAGVAWTKNLKPSFAGGTRDWVSSAGFGARINALGYLIAELSVVRPLNREGRGWMFAFNLSPGF
jgi:Tol biopolymer transport system component